MDGSAVVAPVAAAPMIADPIKAFLAASAMHSFTCSHAGGAMQSLDVMWKTTMPPSPAPAAAPILLEFVEFGSTKPVASCTNFA